MNSIDLVASQRIDTLRRGLAALHGDSSPEAWEQRDRFFQAMGDVNSGWVSEQTMRVIAEAELLAWPEGE